MKPTRTASDSSPNDDPSLDEAIAEYLIAEDEGHPLDVEGWLCRHDSLRHRLLTFLQDQHRAAEALAGHAPATTPGGRGSDPMCNDSAGSTEDGTLSGYAGSTGYGSTGSDNSGLIDTIEFPSDGGPLLLRQSQSSSRFPFEPVRGIGIYRFERLLGTGGMGRVYEAVDDQGHRFAIKLISSASAPSQETVERFKQEGLIASSINHPRCVFVHAADTADGQPFIAMELMPGTTLKDWVQAHGPLLLNDAIEKILDVLDGLHAAHQCRLIHRDVKPSNCYIDSQGRVKVGDFGLAKSVEVDSGLTRTGNIVGTPLFASPEQLRGETLDVRTDVYSTCATLYYLLAGKAPYEHPNPTTLIARVLTEDAIPIRDIRSDIPLELERVLQTGLSRNRDARPASMEALRDLLSQFLPRQRRSAGVAVRFAAMSIDLTLISLVMVLAALLRPEWFTDQEVFAPQLRIESHVLTSALQALYFLTCEYRFRTTLGKRLVGLRVQLSDAQSGWSLGRCAIRVGVWWLASGVVTDCLLVWFGRPLLMTFQDPLQWLGYAIGYLLLCWPLMRNRDMRMLHDLASGTQVEHLVGSSGVLRLLEWQKTRIEGTSENSTIAQDGGAASAAEHVFGRFRDCKPMMSLEGGRWYEGQDRALSRTVWILVRSEESGELTEERRAMARATRLRWIASGVQEQRRWDAFLAVDSIPISELAAHGVVLDWRTIRRGLLDVAHEIELTHDARTDSEDQPPRCEHGAVALPQELRNLRVSRDGTLVWLDGVAHESEPNRSGGAMQGAMTVRGSPAVTSVDSSPPSSANESKAVDFLRSVANALLGRGPNEPRLMGEEREIPYSAMQALMRLEGDHPKAWDSVANFANALKLGDDSLARSGFRRRAIQIATQFALSIGPFGAMLALLGAGHLLRMNQIQDEWLHLHSLRRIANDDAADRTTSSIEVLSKAPGVQDIDWRSEAWQRKLLEEIDRLEASHRADRTNCSSIDIAALRSSGTLFLDSPTVEGLVSDDRLVSEGVYVWELPNEVPAKCAPYAVGVANENVSVNDAMREAFRVSGSMHVKRLAESLVRVEQGRLDVPLHKAGRLVLLSLAGWILLSLWGMVFKGGIGRWVAGLVVVDAQGRLAGRWRLLWRAVVLWGPLGLCLSATICLDFWGWTGAWLSFALRTTCVVLPFVYLAIGMLSGRRGMHDRLSGTHVVPR